LQEEFELNNSEKLHGDFRCTFSSATGTHHGRLYITDLHICFNSNVLGVYKKITLQMKEIVSISTNKVFGIFNSGILIVTKQNIQYKFG